MLILWAGPGGRQPHAPNLWWSRPAFDGDRRWNGAGAHPGEMGAQHAIFKRPSHERELPKLLTSVFKKVRLNFLASDWCLGALHVLNTHSYSLDISIHFLSSFTSPECYLWRFVESSLRGWGLVTCEGGPSQSLGGQESRPFNMEIELCEQSPSYLLKSVKLIRGSMSVLPPARPSLFPLFY